MEYHDRNNGYPLRLKEISKTDRRCISRSYLILPEYIQALFSKRFLLYGSVGLSGVGVNMGVLMVLRECFEVNLTWSAAIAAELAIINNFILNDVWTFRDISLQHNEWPALVKRFLRFNTVSFSGLILHVLTLQLLVNVTALSELLAAFLSIATVTLWNYRLNVKFSWVTKSVTKPQGDF